MLVRKALAALALVLVSSGAGATTVVPCFGCSAAQMESLALDSIPWGHAGDVYVYDLQDSQGTKWSVDKLEVGTMMALIYPSPLEPEFADGVSLLAAIYAETGGTMSKQASAEATGGIVGISAFDVARDGPSRQAVLNWIANGSIQTVGNFVTAQALGLLTLNNAVRSLLGQNVYAATVTLTFSDGSRSTFEIFPDRVEYKDDSSYDVTNNRIPEDASDAEEFLHDYSGGGENPNHAQRMREHLFRLGFFVPSNVEKWICRGTAGGVTCTRV